MNTSRSAETLAAAKIRLGVASFAGLGEVRAEAAAARQRADALDALADRIEREPYMPFIPPAVAEWRAERDAEARQAADRG
jgi:hypothetical protein